MRLFASRQKTAPYVLDDGLMARVIRVSRAQGSLTAAKLGNMLQAMLA
jgi:hypothetical protein